MRAIMTIDDIRDNFALLDDWDDRYRYVIELGRTLTPMPEDEHSAANKVQGCASQVWLSKMPRNRRSPTSARWCGSSRAPRRNVPRAVGRTARPIRKVDQRGNADKSHFHGVHQV